MSKRPRSPNAARRASFGRAERLRREAGDTSQPKQDAPRKEPSAERPDRQEKQTARRGPARDPARHDGPPPLHLIKQRLARSGAADERRRLDRLEMQTRSGFNRAAERRRDPAGRAEHARKQEISQRNARRIEEHQRRSDQKRLERTRGETTRAHAQAADRRRDTARRAEHERKQKAFQEKARRIKLCYRRRDEMKRAFTLAADRRRDQAQRIEHARRQQHIQHLATQQIEKEQKNRATALQAEHRDERKHARAVFKTRLESYRDNDLAVIVRHCTAVKALHDREDRKLAELQGRRGGLVGTLSELVPGRRAANDRKVEEIKRDFEDQRMTKHRELQSYQERMTKDLVRKTTEHYAELKRIDETYSGHKTMLSRDQASERPRLIEDRARHIDRADQAREQAGREQARQDQPRENVGPSGDFGRAASDRAHEPKAAPRELHNMGR